MSVFPKYCGAAFTQKQSFRDNNFYVNPTLTLKLKTKKKLCVPNDQSSSIFRSFSAYNHPKKLARYPCGDSCVSFFISGYCYGSIVLAINKTDCVHFCNSC